MTHRASLPTFHSSTFFPSFRQTFVLRPHEYIAISCSSASSNFSKDHRCHHSRCTEAHRPPCIRILSSEHAGLPAGSRPTGGFGFRIRIFQPNTESAALEDVHMCPSLKTKRAQSNLIPNGHAYANSSTQAWLEFLSGSEVRVSILTGGSRRRFGSLMCGATSPARPKARPLLRCRTRSRMEDECIELGRT